jgi:hypothetical protein
MAQRGLTDDWMQKVGRFLPVEEVHGSGMKSIIGKIPLHDHTIEIINSTIEIYPLMTSIISSANLFNYATADN